MTTLPDLITLLENATGPDREMDLAIANLEIDDGKPWRFVDTLRIEVTRDTYGPGANGNPHCGLEYFTRHVEDAAELVTGGFRWQIRQDPKNYTAIVHRGLGPDKFFRAFAKTPANALAAAALRSRLTGGER